MKRAVVISVVLVAVVVVLLIATSVVPLTGNITGIDKVTFAGQTCIDSDGHLGRGSISEAGKVTTKIEPNGEKKEFLDWCKTTRKIVEYECTNKARINILELNCPNGGACREGKCVPIGE